MLTLWKPNLLRRKGDVAPSADRSPAAFFDEIDRFFDRALQDFALAPIGWSDHAFTTSLAADVSETADEILVRMDLPGFDPKDIQVTLEGDTLSVAATRQTESRREGEALLRSERTHGTVRRSFRLPAEVDAGRVEARHENGVLRLTLPKREDAKPRAITVKVT